MIKPYGGKALTPLFVADDSRRRALGEEARHLPSVLMTSSASGNAVMLGAGYFSPLREFMNVGEALGVAERMELPGLGFWPVPILNVPDGGPFPRKEMIYGQWGQKDKLILSLDSWLCIQCNDCSTACPRGAKPGDVMAAVRSMSVQAYSVPAFIARAAATPSLLWLLFAIPALILATAIVGMHAGSGFDFLEGRIVFGKMMPVAAIDAIFVPAIVFAGATSLLGLRRFLAAMRREYPRAQNGDPLRAAVLGTVKDILSHRFFRQCETNQVGFGAHVAVMYGFIGLSITTTVVGVLYYLNKFQMEVAVSPYDTLHPVKILGNVSGLMAFLGCAAMVTHRMTRSTAGKASFFDWTFLWVLFLTVITGFLCQLFRVFATALLAYSTYYIHLILVFFLLAYLPYTKFAHIFFRTVAMIFARWSGRDLPQPVTVA